MEQIATRNWLIGVGQVTENKHHFYRGEVIKGLLGIAFSDSGDFVVTSEKDGYLDLVEKGRKHRTHRVNKNTVRPISKRFGIGFYYEDNDMPEFLSDAEVDKLIEEAQQERQRLKKRKKKSRRLMLLLLKNTR